MCQSCVCNSVVKEKSTDVLIIDRLLKDVALEAAVAEKGKEDWVLVANTMANGVTSVAAKKRYHFIVSCLVRFCFQIVIDIMHKHLAMSWPFRLSFILSDDLCHFVDGVPRSTPPFSCWPIRTRGGRTRM